MLAPVITGILILVSCYLGTGILFVAFWGRKHLSVLDPAWNNASRTFRLLMVPGLVTFWPLFYRRGRVSALPEESEGTAAAKLPPSPGNKLRPAVFLMLSVGAPLLILPLYLSKPLPDYEENISREVFPLPSRRARRSKVFGEIFSSIPATVSLARRRGGRSVLYFQFREESATQPVGIYWAPAVNPETAEPEGAVFLGTVAGPRHMWVTLPEKSMQHSGYWIGYSAITKHMEHFSVPPPHYLEASLPSRTPTPGPTAGAPVFNAD